MVDKIDSCWLWIISKLGRNKKVPWEYTAMVMRYREAWYLRHRKWCDKCKAWVRLARIDEEV